MEQTTVNDAGVAAGEQAGNTSRRCFPSWLALLAALAVSLIAAGGVVRLQRLADTYRQTELSLLRASNIADQCHLSQQHFLGRGALGPDDVKTWKKESSGLDTAMGTALQSDSLSQTLAHVKRAFGHYQAGAVKEEQSLAARQAKQAQTIDAVQTSSAWQLYRQSLVDVADEYDHRASQIQHIAEGVILLAFLAAASCLFMSFRRFGADRYTSAALTTQNELLRRSEKRFRSLVQNASEVMAILGEDGTAFYLSPAVRRMWGYTPESLVGKHLFDVISPDDQKQVQELFGQARGRAGKSFTGEASVRHQNESWRCCHIVMLNLLAEPEVNGIVVTFRDITQLKQGQEALRQAKGSLEVRVAERTADLAKANSELQTEICERQALEEERERLLADALERADHDPLTGLVNHRAFHKRLEEEADRALRQGTTLAIALLDLDNFKFFNDAYSHMVGDEVLREVGRVLKGCCRSYDVLARYGGDEFAMLMPGTSAAEVPLLAARLRERLAEAMYRPPDSDTAIPLSMSMGIAVFPDDEPVRLAALELADARLLRSKTGGEETDGAETLRKSLNDSVAGFSMLDALLTAVNNKDRYTRRHSEDVMTFSLQIAREMELDAATQDNLATAALLHDVGKIGVPDSVLRKPSALTPEEIEVIKHHPMMGSVIVAAVLGLEATLDAVRHHHERWDGLGYPFGLKGLEIPFDARLMAVADAFSAMTTDRPYRKGHPESEALGFLAEGSGTQWDPDCVTAFLSARRKLRGEPESPPLSSGIIAG